MLLAFAVSCIQATPLPPDAKTIARWADFDASVVNRLNMEPGSYNGPWLTNGATATHSGALGLTAWDGTPFVRLTPPTAEQAYSGIGDFPLPPGATSLSLRWEMRLGPTYTSGCQTCDDNKFVIVHTANGNRPMFNLQPVDGDCLALAIGQGTVKQFNQSNQGGTSKSWYRTDGTERFRWCDGKGGGGKKIVRPGEWVTVEGFFTCPNAQYPQGAIRAIVHARTGLLADWWIPWNYDAPARCTSFTSIEAIGDYFNGYAPRADGTYFDVAGVTIALGRTTPLGPRTGFLQ